MHQPGRRNDCTGAISAHKLASVLQTVSRPGPEVVARRAPDPAATMREQYLTAYRWMLLARLSEEKYASLYRAGKIYGGVFIGKGTGGDFGGDGNVAAQRAMCSRR